MIGHYRYTGAVSFGSWPSTFPSVTGSGTPGYLLYATVSGSTASTLGVTGPLGSLDFGNNDGISASPITAGVSFDGRYCIIE
jgi:hypothetical protein